MIQRYTPSKLVDYSWDSKTEDAHLAFGEECEPGAGAYEVWSQPLVAATDYDELRASYFDNLKRWIDAERYSRRGPIAG